MNSDSPKTPREELEARLTALLLGELSADEGAAIRRALAQDAELAKLHDRLQATIGLVHETVATHTAPAAEQPPLKLSDKRREELLAHFKTVPLLPRPASRQKVERSWLIPASLAAALVVLFGIAVLTPNFVRSRNTSQANAVLNNLRQLDNAKQMWALENKKPDTAEPRFDELLPYLKGDSKASFSVEGEKYVLGRVQDEVIAETRRGEQVRLPEERESNLARVSGTGGTPQPAAPGRLPAVGLSLRTWSVSDAGKSQEKYTFGGAGGSEARLKELADAPAMGTLTPATPTESPRAGMAIILPANEKPEPAPTTAGFEVAAGKVESWHFDAGAAGVTDDSRRLGRDESKVNRGFYSDFSQDSFGRANTGLPQQNVSSIPASGDVAGGNFYGGFAFKPEQSPAAKAEISGLSPTGLEAPVQDGRDKTPVLGDTPMLGTQFYRLTGGAGGSGGRSGGGQTAPAASTIVPAAPLVSVPRDSTVAQQVQDDLAPLQLQLPAPALRGSPVDLPKGAIIETQTGMPATAPALAESKTTRKEGQSDQLLTGSPRRRYGLEMPGYDDPGQFAPQALSASTGNEPLVASLPQQISRLSKERLAENVALEAATTPETPAVQESTTLNFGVAAVRSPAPVQAKEPEAVAGRGITPLASAGAGGESTINAGDLVLSRGAAEVEQKKVAEVRERYLADGTQLEEAGRIAPQEKVQSLDVDALTVTAAAPKDAVGVVVAGADRGRKSSVVLPTTDAGVSLGIEQTQTEELARAKIAPAPSQSAQLVQDGKVLWELGKLDEAEAKLNQAKEAAPDDRTASYYMDLVKDSRRNQEARQRGVAGKSALVMTRQTGTGPIPTSEARPTSELATLDERLAKSQLKASELRQELAISDAAASGIGTSPLLEAETLRRLEPLQINSEAQYVREAKLLEQLKATPKGEIKKILPTMIQDPQLTELNRQLNLAEQTRTQLKKDLPEMHPSVLSVNKQVQDLDRKIAERADGITRGLEVRVASMKGQMDSLKANVDRAQKAGTATPSVEADVPPVRKPSTNAPIPQPEVQTSDNAFSTFSLNVSDVAFKLAAASLEKGQMPDAASVRAEEFINAFYYRDPEAPPGMPVAFAWERARYPFAHNRDLLRFSVKTAAAGRQAGRPLNLVLLLDNSGSMERADRVQIIREALRVLAGQLQPQDRLSVITFARTPRLWVDGVAGDKSGEVLEQVSGLTPQGGTNLEEAMNLAYATALRHYLAGGINRVVLLTDGAANLGNVEPEPLKQKVELHRKQGIALDCFGIGWEGFNDDLLEVLSRNGDGRYGFINSPEETATEFAGQLAGALKVAASDVKVQVEFNPKRVTAYRQIGYAKHQLTKEQFRDNTVDAAEIAAQEAGNALYTVEVNPAGEGPLCIVRCRFKITGTTDYREHEWAVPYTGNAASLEQSSPAMRLAASASAFAEWLVVSPFAAEVTPDALLGYLGGVPEVYGADARPKKLEWMIHQAKSVAGR